MPDDGVTGIARAEAAPPPEPPAPERRAGGGASEPPGASTRPGASTTPDASATATATAPGTAERSTDDLIAEFDEERAARRLPRRLDLIVTAYCFAVTVFVLYQVFFPLRQGQQYWLIVFLGLTLPLAFLLYRARSKPGAATQPTWWDWTLTIAGFLVCFYPLLPVAIGDGGGGFNAFLDRQGSLGTVDIVAGTVLTVLILEAARRTTGLVLPIFCLVFFAFAYYGGYLPMDWAISHAGVDFDQIINGFFNDQSGFYGTPLSVAASYIVLFIIYGAVLQATGAGRFFIDFSFSLFRSSRSAAGRTVVTSGFLLGTVSGSGTATAVTLGSLAWPVLKRAGYPANPAGGVLAAAGIGAILSPPTLGAAAFIIAEYLSVSYLDVMIWAIVPTILYYVGIFIAVEIDARRFGANAIDMPRKRTGWLLARFGYHFLSLGVIVFFLAVGLPPFRAIVYATGVAAVFGLIERIVSRRDPLDDDAVTQPLGRALADYARELFISLSTGIRSAIPVVAVCAAAGIITSVIVKTGVGLTFARMLVGVAESLASDPRAILAITAVLAAVAIILLGLAVPVTASFIISWVIIGPALITLGVERPEAAMFIFYYAVLSEVSPPTALAAVASAAITGGDTMRTMWQATKYTLPAFLAPLAFVLTPAGGSLLLQGDLLTTLWAGAVSVVAVAALAGATGGWVFARATWVERVLLLVGAIACLYLEPVSIAAGLAFLVAAALLNGIRTRFGRNDPDPAPHAPITSQEGTSA
ncbi:TRAP transporter permease [Agromyces archimandritae]|uniref:TRAP transporter fused permease subunit n=1 Tax=Agromyces archimandritae TaxID=2781962 RepID=A0A975FPX9_9MICO|nr:TRAP transporter fused permease subunit [Agromyces archimandritae]QTX05849.1 TRAP transporter fused permease subunit [Agromyces archimandritae]